MNTIRISYRASPSPAVAMQGCVSSFIRSSSRPSRNLYNSVPVYYCLYTSNDQLTAGWTGQREFLGHGIERHNTGRLLLDRQILDSQIQSTVERKECRVSLFQRPPFPCSYLWLTFWGVLFCFIDGRDAGCVCILIQRAAQALTRLSLVIHHLITWALAVGVFSPRLTLYCGLSWDSLVHCRLHFIRFLDPSLFRKSSLVRET